MLWAQSGAGPAPRQFGAEPFMKPPYCLELPVLPGRRGPPLFTRSRSYVACAPVFSVVRVCGIFALRSDGAVLSRLPFSCIRSLSALDSCSVCRKQMSASRLRHLTWRLCSLSLEEIHAWLHLSLGNAGIYQSRSASREVNCTILHSCRRIEASFEGSVT